MTLNHNGTPIELSFHFCGRSDRVRETIMKLLEENKSFVLYSDDNTFKVYIPEAMSSFNQNRTVTNYDTVSQLKADLSFDIMIFDFVQDLTPAERLEINEIKLIL